MSQTTKTVLITLAVLAFIGFTVFYFWANWYVNNELPCSKFDGNDTNVPLRCLELKR